jgi:hypothetical protein
MKEAETVYGTQLSSYSIPLSMLDPAHSSGMPTPFLWRAQVVFIASRASHKHLRVSKYIKRLIKYLLPA